jgi:parvulin-like peptidyl-prolyl isomerase
MNGNESHIVAWWGERPVTDDDLAYQKLASGGVDEKETVWQASLRSALADIARAEGVVVDQGAVDRRWAILKNADGYADTLEVLGLTEERLREELAVDELVGAWLETDEPVADAEAVAFYNDRFRNAVAAEAGRLRHILVAVDADRSRADAETLIRTIAASDEPFERKAERHSDCPSGAVGGDLGWMRRDAVMPELARFFDATPGHAPEIVETALGYHLVQRVDYAPARTVTPEEGVAMARSRLAGLKRKERLAALMAEIRGGVRFADEGA